MAVDDIYRLTISATDTAATYQNVYYLRTVNENPVTSAMFANFAADAIAVWTPIQPTAIVYTTWSAVQTWGTGMTMVANECRREGGQQFADVFATTGGAGASERLPPQCSLVVTWNTGFAGRRKRGRTYGFGLRETDQTDGRWTTVMLSALTTRLNTFIAEYRYPSGTSPDFQLTVWSERTASGCVPATPPAKGHVQVETPHPELASTPVTSFTVRPIVYTQRRRTLGVGR